MIHDPALAGFMPWVVFAFGLIFGSFLNVVIHRLPRQESLVQPGSHCPACGAAVRWYHNLPVVSYLALGGRCAGCRAPISPRYPLVEVAAAAALLLVYLRFGSTPGFWIYAPYALALVALFAIDLEHQLLPDAITLPGTALGLLLSPWNRELGASELPWRVELLGSDLLLSPWMMRVLNSVLGAVVGYGLLWVLREGYYRLRQEEGMGGGDLKLAAMIGAFSGARALVVVLFAASLVGVVVGVTLIALKRAGAKTPIPFGCFLAPAAFLVALLGADFLWYGWSALVLRYVYHSEVPGDGG